MHKMQCMSSPTHKRPPAAETRRTVSGSDTPLDLDRLIPAWVNDLQSVRRAAAVDGLTECVSSRILALAVFIDRTAPVDNQVRTVSPAKMKKVVETSLFADRQPATVREFCERGATLSSGIGWSLASKSWMLLAGIWRQRQGCHGGASSTGRPGNFRMICEQYTI